MIRFSHAAGAVALVASVTIGLSVAAPEQPPASAAASSEVIARGKYLTDMGDCAACHTAEGGARLAGGHYMNTPFGALSTPNITPDKETGIGTYTDDEFYRVFHDGVGRVGHLYPAMPYPWYRNVTRDDVLAIKAYLMTLEPVHAPRKDSHIGFPFNIRLGLALWDAAFLGDDALQAGSKASDQVKRGAYIVNGLEHCGECHNENKLLGNISWSHRLRGGAIDNWYAPNITSDEHYGIGRFSDDQMVQYLKTGAAPTMGSVLGPMAQTVHESLSKLTDSDLHAVVAYLKSTQPLADYKDARYSDFTGVDPTGAQTYLSYCASCHQQNGQGVPGKIPSLDGNGAITSGGPENIIRVILGGVNAQDSYGPMAALGASMSDKQIADVTNYIRQSWSNKAPANAEPGKVAALRKETHTLLAGNLGSCPELAQENMVKIVARPEIAALLQSTNQGNLTQNANQIIGKVKAADPQVKQADIVNSLTIAYCPVVAADDSLSQQQKIWQLDQFGETVYTQLTTKGAL